LLFRIWAVLLANIGGIYPFVVIPLNQGPVEFPGLARYFLPMTTAHYLTANVDGLNISYRQARRSEAPTLLLLHGFPSADHMFRDLIPLLADRYHVVAPDLPGFGQSDMPARDEFNYTFNNLAEQSCCACAERIAKETSRFLKCLSSKFLEESRKINPQTGQHDMNATIPLTGSTRSFAITAKDSSGITRTEVTSA